MRQSSSKIPLYSKLGTFLVYIKRAEALSMSQEKPARLRLQVRGFGKNQEIIAAQFTELLRDERPSPCHITAKETFLNAMVAAKMPLGADVSISEAESVCGKVGAWPYVFDDKAVRVGPRI